MRRSLFAVPALALALLAPAALAQDATPPADGPPMMPGVSVEFVGAAPISELPADPAVMAVVRLTLEPGAGFPAEPTDPTASFLLVESGQVTVVAVEAVPIGRAGEDGFAEVAAGEEAVLNPGDTAFARPFIAAGLRNDGDEPAVLLLVNIVGADGMMDGEAGATPAP